ncbi:MAG TPA: restriction endonuclease subunit S [Spirochaetota bacterium]|nr:restriction endonuclease subunit S [Spirochaetota bacterium]
MDVKPGYKQTEVGVIPEDWEAVPIESLTPPNRKNGIVDGPFGSNLKTIHYRTSGIPIITSGYVTDGMFRADHYLYVDRSKFLEEKRSSVHPGDIVMAKIGERCGASAILPATHETGILSGNALKITVDEARHSTSYVWQVLWGFHVSGKLEVLRTVGAQPALSIANLKRFKIPVPSTNAEQRAIAAALGDVDALLAGLDRLIAKKRDLKQAAMQQLLTGQTRLPGFSGEWDTLPACDIGVFKGGSGFPLMAQGETNGEYPFFKVSDMNNEGNEIFMTIANHYISDQARKRLGATAFPAESIVFAKVGAAVFLERKKILKQPSCIDNNMAAFVLDRDRVDVRFVHFLLLSTKLSDLVATTALPALNAKQLGEMALSVPPLTEQAAIATVLSDMDAELMALEARRDKTRDLKQGMMQELLTGRTRLV